MFHQVRHQLLVDRGGPLVCHAHDLRRFVDREALDVYQLIQLLLPIAVVHGQLCGVLVHIMRVVVGILRQPPSAEPLAHVLVEGRLHERVQILLPLPAPPHVVHDGPRDASRRMVEIALHLPTALIEAPVEVTLDPLGMDIAVLSDGRGVPCRRPVGVAALIAELILSAGRQEACAQRRADPLRQPLLPKQLLV